MRPRDKAGAQFKDAARFAAMFNLEVECNPPPLGQVEGEKGFWAGIVQGLETP